MSRPEAERGGAANLGGSRLGRSCDCCTPYIKVKGPTCPTEWSHRIPAAFSVVQLRRKPSLEPTTPSSEAAGLIFYREPVQPVVNGPKVDDRLRR
jgi:hypothetical protein